MTSTSPPRRLPTALQRASRAALPPGEHVGQESFMRASEIRQLARRAGIGPGVEVLDLCCGVAGPGRLITAELGCGYLGVDRCAGALEIARTLAGDLPCRFERRDVPSLPAGRFDVVLLLETVLAFPDKRTLFGEVARALAPDGRFAFTVEEGRPLTAAEREQMPGADTVWLARLSDLVRWLRDAGLTINWLRQRTAAHQATAQALLQSYRANSADIVDDIGGRRLAELITAHQLWSDWLGAGRVRKFEVVASRGAS